MNKRIMVQCSTLINKDAIRRENIKGVEHIIVASSTLPDNIVMNGGLYPAEEIAKSFKTLERTLAPIEHPVDSDGKFLSATDPDAINSFYAGVFNTNVRRENGRVHLDKTINVPEALKSDRGKRLLDRVNEIETNANPRPIHTSTGLFLEVEQHAEPRTNEAGIEYTWTGRNFMFDHDAILLDSVAAATPGQGVGMAVNAAGDEIEVNRVTLEPTAPTRTANDKRTNAEGTSFGQIEEQLRQSIQGQVAADWICLTDVFNDEVIFETPQGYFSSFWNMMNGSAELNGLPFRVVKEVKYTPKVNNDGGNGKMKEKMVIALNKAGIKTEGLTDDQIFDAHAEMLTNTATEAAEAVAQANAEANAGTTDVAKAVTEALKPVVEQINTLTTKINAADEAEVTRLAELVGNSDKHPGVDVEAAKALPIDTLKSMAAHCQGSTGIGFTQNHDGDDGFSAPTEMTD